MKSSKVHLYIRVLNAAGPSVFAEPAWNKNRTLKACYTAIDSHHHPEGVYYLRFLKKEKRVWEAAGKEPDAVLMALRRAEQTLQASSLGLEGALPPTSPHNETSSAPTSLQMAIQEYPNLYDERYGNVLACPRGYS